MMVAEPSLEHFAMRVRALTSTPARKKAPEHAPGLD
jgi:hypothetical protein